MASVSKNKKTGRVMVQFTLDGERKTISLPAATTLKTAGTIRSHVEALLAAKYAAEAVEYHTADWLAKIGDELHEKLAAVGLCLPRRQSLLGQFLSEYIVGRTDVDAHTNQNMRNGRTLLIQFFGEVRTVQSITPADAKAWSIWLQTVPLKKPVGRIGFSGPTRGRLIKLARQFFAHAIDQGQLAANPFKGVKAPSQSNKDREFFIDGPLAVRVLEACPNAEWRLRWVLARWGGLRVPSEMQKLQWIDVNWEASRMLVRGKGKRQRIMPIFPEIRPHLEAVWDAAKLGDVYVLPRKSATKIRSWLERILVTAGVSQWERIWQNLRASRRTELSRQFPAHIVNAWMGHSEAVAQAHYLMATDEDFLRAATGQTALQNPLQPAAKSAVDSGGHSNEDS